METPASYQVVFNGHLRSGFSEAQVREQLLKRLKLPEATVTQLFTPGPHVLKRTLSHAEAKHIVLQLATVGAITTIEQNGQPVQKAATTTPSARAENGGTGKDTSAELPRFAPLRQGWKIKPAYLVTAMLEAGLILFYFLMLGAGLVVLLTLLFSGLLADLIPLPAVGTVLDLLLLLAGTIVWLVLARPLLSLRDTRRRGIVVTARQEPDLHAFIEDVCERIGATPPAEIRINNDYDITLHYQNGPLGFWTQRTVMIIGVPLVAGMNCSQLAALVAQSVGIFRGKATPRTSSLVRLNADWLQRAVYGEDELDRLLARWRRSDRLVALLPYIESLGRLSRRITARRLATSQRLVHPLIHRLVADADKIALAFTGTEGYIRMLEQMRLMSHAASELIPTLRQRWQEGGKLPDNLVHALVLQSRRYPSTIAVRLREEQERQKAATADLFPSDAQRLKRIAHQPIFGAYYCLSPAAVLFRNYGKLTHTMTLRYYHHRMRMPVSPYRMEEVVSSGSLAQQLQQRLDHYFRSLFTDFMAMKLRRHMHEVDELGQARERWRTYTARIDAEYQRASAAHESFLHSEAVLVDASTDEMVHLAGLWQQWHMEQLQRGEAEVIHQSARESEAAFEQAGNSLEQYLKTYSGRLGTTLGMLALPEATALENNAALRKEGEHLVSLLERLDNVVEPLRQLRLQCVLLETLLSFREGRRNNKLEDRLQEESQDIQHLVTTIRVALKSAPYPFTGEGFSSVVGYALKEASEEAGPAGELERGRDMVQRLSLLRRRIIVRLCAIALHVEKGMGL